MGIGIGVSKMNGFAGENVCVAGLLRAAMVPVGWSDLWGTLRRGGGIIELWPRLPADLVADQRMVSLQRNMNILF